MRRRMAVRWIVLSFLVLLGWNHHSSALASLNVNLITNPGAEAGPASSNGFAVVAVPGWTTTGNFTVVAYGTPGGFPSLSDPVPPNPGQNFFSGGVGPTSSAVQVINVSSDAALIDLGVVSFALTGWLGGYLNHPDQAQLIAVFQNGSGNALGSASIGPVNNADRSNVTEFLLRSTNGLVPIGTRQVQLTLAMTRFAGDYNDGYADNLSLVFRASQPQAVPEPSTLALAGCLAACLRGFHRSRRRA